MTKSQRQKRGLYLAAELARAFGIPRPTLDYHIRRGDIEPPSVAIGERLCFTRQQAVEIKAYFDSRQRYERQPDVIQL